MRTDRAQTAGSPAFGARASGADVGAGAIQARLPDGRLHLQHGPIDLVIAADGAPTEVDQAYGQAARCFAPVLSRLVAELPALKRPVGRVIPVVSGPVARRMVRAVWPYRDRFITPMAAVAGAVAEHVLAGLTAGRTLRRAYVNNGGDIAIWLAAGETLTLGVVSSLVAPQVDRRIRLSAASAVRGVATSGWSGRSFSLGIADAVTVFAPDAPAADAAATILANAVTVEHPGVIRAPADSIQADTDLGALPVTVAVAIEDPGVLAVALDAGVREAERQLAAGRIGGALLFLGGQCRAVGWSGA
jgi:ApbE superfamily uncharacterized protein (UPF0280 family)